MRQHFPSERLKGEWPITAIIHQEDAMKKNLGSKMKLTRETLRSLERPEIKTVVGGLSVRATCTCCNTTRLTCSTRLC